MYLIYDQDSFVLPLTKINAYICMCVYIIVYRHICIYYYIYVEIDCVYV